MKLRASVPISPAKRPGLHQMALRKVGRLVGRKVRMASANSPKVAHGSHIVSSIAESDKSLARFQPSIGNKSLFALF